MHQSPQKQTEGTKAFSIEGFFVQGSLVHKDRLLIAAEESFICAAKRPPFPLLASVQLEAKQRRPLRQLEHHRSSNLVMPALLVRIPGYPQDSQKEHHD